MSFYIKQYGFQRSGTNILKAILEVNFKRTIVLSNYLGDKHEFAGWSVMMENLNAQNPKNYGLNGYHKWKLGRLLAKKDLPVVINVKEPVSWVNSFYKYQKKKVLYKNPDASFPLNIDFAKKVLGSYENKLVSWGEFNRINDLCLVFKHEQLVEGLSDDDLFAIKDKFGLKPSSLFPTGELSGYARRGIDSQRGGELVNEKMSFNRGYHLHGLWREDMPENVLQFLQAEKIRMIERLPDYISELIE